MTSNATSESQVFRNFISRFETNAKSVLEIGGVINEDLIHNLNTKWVSVDPLYTPSIKYELILSDRILNTVEHIKEDITKPLFNDNEFDFIFSCNAFQHIGNLKIALDNSHKWLKDEGILYSNFGPIWTAPDGCHIEGLEYQDRIFNFWEYKLVPFWSHLLFTHEEMLAYLKQFYSEELSKKITYSIYKSPWINRLTYTDYRNLINEDIWEIIEFRYSKKIDYLPKELYVNQDLAFEKNCLKKLNIIRKENYKAHDLLIVIKKRKIHGN